MCTHVRPRSVMFDYVACGSELSYTSGQRSVSVNKEFTTVDLSKQPQEKAENVFHGRQNNHIQDRFYGCVSFIIHSFIYWLICSKGYHWVFLCYTFVIHAFIFFLFLLFLHAFFDLDLYYFHIQTYVIILFYNYVFIFFQFPSV